MDLILKIIKLIKLTLGPKKARNHQFYLKFLKKKPKIKMNLIIFVDESFCEAKKKNLQLNLKLRN